MKRHRVRFASSAGATAFAPAEHLAPRCGRVLVLDGRYERSGEAGDPGNPPVCGRPLGHPGTPGGGSGCRSEAAVARDVRAARDRRRARMAVAA